MPDAADNIRATAGGASRARGGAIGLLFYKGVVFWYAIASVELLWYATRPVVVDLWWGPLMVWEGSRARSVGLGFDWGGGLTCQPAHLRSFWRGLYRPSLLQ